MYACIGYPPYGNYVFKKLGTADIDTVLELEYLIFSSPWSKEQYDALMRAGICSVFGVFSPGRLCGYAAASMSRAAGQLEIYNLAVHPQERRRGLAVRLLKLILDAAGRLGLERAILEVRAGNLAACALYQGLGFTPCGLRRDYYSAPLEDALLLELELKYYLGQNIFCAR